MPRQTKTLPYVAAGLVTIGQFAALPALAAAADYTVSESLSSIPQNAAITLLDLGQSASSGFVSASTISLQGGAETISFTGSSGIYSGNTSGVAAAPYTATGPDKLNYLAAEPKSAVSISFASQQQYFGVLWGSVDSYNSLTFYNNNTVVATLTGNQIAANANGNQTAVGSYIVNTDFTNGASFNRVVATSSSPAFEFDSVAFAATAVPITVASIAAATAAAGGSLGSTNVMQVDPAPMALPGGTPLGVLMLGLGSGWLILGRRRFV